MTVLKKLKNGIKQIDTILKKSNNFLFGARTHKHLQLDALDGVRGLAIIFVLFSHAANRDLVLAKNLKFAGDGSGQMGVYLFFTLSAFLLTRGLIGLGEDKLKSFIVWADYSLRRILRIYPLYCFVLLTVVAAAHLKLPCFFPNFKMKTFWSHVFVLDGQFHFWTIATEVKYYLILPVFIVFFVFLCRRNVFAAAAGAIVVSFLTQYYMHRHPPQVMFSVVRYLPIFLMGTLAAILHNRRASVSIPPKVLTALSIAAFAAMLLLMPNLYKRLISESYPFFDPRWTILWGALFGLFILLVAKESGPVNRIFAWKPLRLIGIASFSMYLWHWFILEGVLMLKGPPMGMRMALFYAATIGFSVMSFILIERPWARIRLYRAGKSSS